MHKSIEKKTGIMFHRQQKKAILFKTTQEPEVPHVEQRNWKQKPLEAIQPSLKPIHIIINNNNLALHV